MGNEDLTDAELKGGKLKARKLKDGASRAARAMRRTARKAQRAANPADLHGPSPNPATNLAIADIALRGGSVLARRAVERAMLGKKYSDGHAKSILRGRSMGETLLHSVLARVALQSVPGAIIVGGGLVAKTLYDRSKAGRAKRAGRVKLDEMAQEGSEE
ncbi:hypothetical protein WSK_2438 [Novosphingobium sp. Rr 2-17]|uniref:hypothetical protein n=1 Tax=Novosphingobium sp. Rr 2-17 TaxID=555793 RepID=UPI000269A832|nr:hypothetical protein [Novosphingobium sp. Rr 2-17]EIZ78895.1 hypothetical protein WSK_2438 [Novosphingobium sp. Rr 2-17]